MTSPAVGADQAAYLIEKAGATKGNNLYLYAGNAVDDNTFVFFEGAWEKLQPRIADGTFVIRNSSVAVALQGNPTLTRDQQARIIGQITTNWDVNTARYLAQGNLMAAAAADKGTVYILAPNDATARAIAAAFAADPAVAKAYVTGQDADKASIQAIIDGRQGMTVFKDPRAAGRRRRRRSRGLPYGRHARRQQHLQQRRDRRPRPDVPDRHGHPATTSRPP